MTSLRLRASVALVLAAFTAACGGGDGSSGPSFPDSVSTADAQDFADGVADYASYVSSAMNFGGPSIALGAQAMAARVESRLPVMTAAVPGVTFQRPDLSRLDWRAAASRAQGLQLSSSAGCSTTAHGFADPDLNDPIDLNGNNIPDDLYFKVVCSFTDTVATDTIVTETLTEEIIIQEITTSLYGVNISERIEQEAHTNHGLYQFIRYNIGGKQDIRSNGIVDQAELKIRQETNTSGDVVFYEAGESWDNAFDPTGTIVPESNIPDGDLTIGGHRYYANSDGENLSFGIHTTDPLAYSAACALADTNPPFTDGTLVGNLNNSSSQASFIIDFTSCANFTVTVNGAYDEVVVSAQP